MYYYYYFRVLYFMVINNIPCQRLLMFETIFGGKSKHFLSPPTKQPKRNHSLYQLFARNLVSKKISELTNDPQNKRCSHCNKTFVSYFVCFVYLFFVLFLVLSDPYSFDDTFYFQFVVFYVNISIYIELVHI